jgi:hypothetical protein
MVVTSFTVNLYGFLFIHMKHYTVYKITNKINGKIYIGIHITDDIDDGYMGSGSILKKAQQKYGIENFEKDYLHIFDSADEMFEMESKLVNESFVSRNDTYNIRQGGIGSWDFVNKNQLNNSGGQRYWYKNKIIKNPEYIETHSKKILKGQLDVGFKFDTFTGKTHTEESKRKIGLANSENQTGNRNSQYDTMWIYNETLKENKKIRKNEPIPIGWVRGRKMKF